MYMSPMRMIYEVHDLRKKGSYEGWSMKRQTTTLNAFIHADVGFRFKDLF